MNGADGRTGSDLLEYRVEQIEITVKDIRISVHDMRNALMPISALGVRTDHSEEALLRAFNEIAELRKLNDQAHETLEAKCARLDGEFQKWFNRGVGVAALAVLLWGLIGVWVVKKVDRFDAAVDAVPSVTQKLDRTVRVQNAMLKRMGLDADLIPLE